MKAKNPSLADMVKACDLQVVAGKNHLSHRIEGGYVSDMLSDVMANCRKGDIWITLQTHPNIIAVAVLKEISAVILINNRRPEPETVKKAEAEHIPILISNLTAFEIAARLSELGISGKR